MSEDLYKSYSLSNLEEWMTDVLDSDSSAEEIYESITDTVKKNMKFHKACYDSSVRLLGLLKGNTNLAVHDGITISAPEGVTTIPSDYYNNGMFDLTSPNLDNFITEIGEKE